MLLSCLGGSDAMPSERRKVCECQQWGMRKTQLMLSTLEREGAHESRNVGDYRSWKRQRHSLPEFPERPMALMIP